MHSITTEIEIAAEPAEVWRVLSQFEHYAQWNPFISQASGSLTLGQQLVLTIEPPGGQSMKFKPTLTVVENERVIEWLGRLGLPGIFDGRHRFELSPSAIGTRVVQSEQFSGLLVGLMKKMLDTKTRAGFNAMNRALKQRVESTSDA